MTNQDNLRAEYVEVNANFRMLTEIRFKLLAFVPTISGAGIALIRWAPDPLTIVLLGVCGFIVTFALIAYDQRNSQLYKDLVSRAKFLEAQLNPPSGQFTKPERTRKLLGFLLWHNFALALVYAVALGGWLFVIVAAFLTWLGEAIGTRVTVVADAVARDAVATDVVTLVRSLVPFYVAYRTAVFVFWRLLGTVPANLMTSRPRAF